MKRRTLLAGVGAVALGGSLWRRAVMSDTGGGSFSYGPLGEADELGIRLPEGFSARLIARSTVEVPGTGHVWHGAPDGGACFAHGDGWIYVSNAELDDGKGGASAVRFDADGTILDAYPILSGTDRNCAGGATPWRTWLSCEEVEHGAVFETDPYGGVAAVKRPAMGRFRHEAAAADFDRFVIYLTEDEPDGCFYRFVPDSWGDLSSGVLQVLGGPNGATVWIDVPDPAAAETPTRHQVAGAGHYDGGEGCHYAGGVCYFTTKGDNRVWAFDAEASTLSVLYGAGAPLFGVDNLTGTPGGDLFVAEDGGDMEICVIAPGGTVTPFLQVTGQDLSELCGVAFNPAGDRLYFSSQRGPSDDNDDGRTYEVTGPFRFDPV
ncbi:alkaline phosphatase PhoX [Phytomonospora sp. NPDC050363]|uniref:alkaline phosphatase PhoX n=1 Tax=Phytomonospora sp. NPDC050363 TaxID=3155642 RepID=UPI0033FA4BE7